VPTQKKPYRVYRGGHGSGDPEAGRFQFGGTVPTEPAASDQGASDLPGRTVATSRGGRWRRIGWKRGVLIITGTVVVVLGLWLFLGYRSFSNEIAKANARLSPRTRATLTPAGNILTSPQISIILGSDSRGEKSNSGERADSILLVRTDPDHQLISLLSIPRDLNVQIPGHGMNKINAAYAYGGAPLLIRTVNNLTGLKVNHVVLVDFSGFEDLINSLGGVRVYNPYKIVSSQPFDGVKWHFNKGWLNLGGRWALAYARIRHTTNPRDSDITRTERQQRVLQALSHKLVSAGSFFNLPSLGTDIGKPLTTDLSANELIGLAIDKYRAGRTLQCHLGGTPEQIGGQDVIQSVPENRGVIGMFLGQQAPQPAPKGELYAPGCTVS
jgi:LCP family protein required for cell wall assembly